LELSCKTSNILQSDLHWQAHQKVQLPNGEATVHISHSIEHIKEAWNLGFNKFMMSHSFLAGLEKAAPGSMSFVYATLSVEGLAVAKAYYQILHFNAGKSLSPELNDEKNQKSFFKNLGLVLKEGIAKNIRFYTLVNGNLLLTGDFSADFVSDINKEDRLIYHRLMNRAVRQHVEQSHKDKVPVFLMKECYEDCRLPETYMVDAHIHEFCIEPNFMMDLPKEWRSFDDYLAKLKGKYRMRAKRALKKSADVTINYLTLDQITFHQSKLFELYQNVATQIGFNMVQLHPNYFESIKSRLPEEFHLCTFEKEERIIGFFTYFLLEEEILAHYVGFDPDAAKDYQLYLNMLLKLIDLAIECNKSKINFGRTAHEIKSSVGAKPVEMYCYIRHKNKLYQALVPKLIEYLSPKEEWEERHPFKEED